MSTIGALLIFFFRKTSNKIDLIANGFAGGVMFASSIWSLIIPAFEEASSWKKLSFIPVLAGFCLGIAFILFLDFAVQKLFKKNKEIARPMRFYTAMTLHNIPEGMAVGVALGAAIASKTALLPAIMFAVGIAIQNLPEGLATALPLHQHFNSTKKAFLLSFLSGITEPVFAIVGFFLALQICVIMPWLLSFAGGAMIFVVIEELTPELKSTESHFGTISFCVGFLLMMLLDVCL